MKESISGEGSKRQVKKTMSPPQAIRAPGRPREFDRDTALRAAMLGFWRQGYEGASLADLTRAMKISKPTLNATFGDKAGLPREALSMYLGLLAED